MTLTDWLLIGLVIAAVASLIGAWNYTLESRAIANSIYECEERCQVIHDCMVDRLKPSGVSNLEFLREDLRRHPKPVDAEIYREGR